MIDRILLDSEWICLDSLRISLDIEWNCFYISWTVSTVYRFVSTVSSLSCYWLVLGFQIICPNIVIFYLDICWTAETVHELFLTMNWFLSTCCGLFRQCADLSSFVSKIFWTVLKVCCFVSTVCEVVSTVCWFILAYDGLPRLRADFFRQCKVVSTYTGLPQNCTDLINSIYFGSSWHCPELSRHILYYFHARIKSFSLFVYNSNKHYRKPKGQSRSRWDSPEILVTERWQTKHKTTTHHRKLERWAT